MEFRDWGLALIYTPLMFYQFYMAWTHYNNMNLDTLANVGWAMHNEFTKSVFHQAFSLSDSNHSYEHF